MTRDEFIAWANRQGWTQDRFGHFHNPTGNYRIKIQAKSIRLERSYYSEVDHCKKYVRLRGAYFGQLSLSADDKLVGLKKEW